MKKQLTVTNDFGYQWAFAGPNTFQMCGRTLSSLPPAAYRCWLDNCGNANFQPQELQVDELIDFPDSLPARIIAELDRFWKSGDRFARYGFLHRRGYLLYGKQGCGKSSLIHQIIARVLAAGHVAFFCQNPYFFVRCLEKFRQVEPDRPMVCIFEDVDAIIEDHGDSELLQWLDGNHQVDKAVNLATTNYPKKLDRRIIARPRRFDRVLRIESPEERVREAYFSRKMPELAPDEVRQWVDASAGLPFAALAELVVSVQCLGSDLDEAADYLRKLDSNSPDSDFFKDETPEEAATAGNDD
jgi:hypothetical protein